MRFLIVTGLVLLAAVPSAMAQSITVIGDDGKRTTVDIGAPAPELKDEKAVPVEPVASEVTLPESSAPEKPSKKSAPEKTPASEEKPVKAKKAAPVPPSRPAAPPPPKEPEQQQNTTLPDAGISEEDAASVALMEAPPSRGYDVTRRSYEGKDAWLVRFRTENGFYDVLVDAVTGTILLSQPTGGPEPAKPGHLPAVP